MTLQTLIRRARLHFIPADARIFHALQHGYRHVIPIWEDYAVSPGILYARLIHMENEGLVWSGYETTAFPRRRVYRLTQRGRMWVDARLHGPVARKLTALMVAP